MTVFLTSSPTGPLDNSRPVDGLDGMNRFIENLKERWRPRSRCLIVAAAPGDHPRNDEMRAFFAGALERSGLDCSAFDLWDARTADTSAETLHGYDAVFLGGGHVPTQNAFFRRLSLREELGGFTGIVIGISAGTMNAASTVYVQPELPGESLDPEFTRWMPGLGLTDLMLLPHYQMVKDSLLDGRRLYEDIIYPDSMGRSFLAIPDGSYVLIERGEATLWGEGWRIADGHVSLISGMGETARL